MDEVIDKIILLAEKETDGMVGEEKVFVYNEVANRMVSRASEEMMASYGMEED